MTSTQADTDTPRPAPGGPSTLPLFYSRPEALRADRHGELGIDLAPDYRFAAKTHAVPLNAIEFGIAARHYPIVFAAGTTPPAAVAVLGLRQDRNLFVDADGAWAADTYVPSYVRRYPFILARNDEASEFALCVDRASDKVRAEGETRFFEGVEPTDAVRKALDFCAAFQRETRESEALMRKITEHDLFAPNAGRFTLPDGEVLNVNDFSIIDEARVNGLSDEAFLDLRKAGALPVIYAHLWSMRNWADLVRRTADG